MVFWLGAGAVLPSSGADDTDKTIPVLATTAQEAAGTPGALIWQRAREVRVPLQPAFPGHHYISGTPVASEVTVQAVRAGNVLYVRLRWSDKTANTAASDTHRFVDGVAVQFPVSGKTSTSPFMGDARNPVNVWHWRADGRTESLVAYGFGTATRVPFEGLKSAAARTDSGWAVVLSRLLKVKPGEGASLQGKTTPIAFAAWDGDNQERDGLKAVTLEWWQLKF